MGVKGLWKALNPIKEIVPISSLRGKVLAVDLAIWVVQSETVTNNVYDCIYLRQTFYKINHLLEHGVGVIIVTDGRAPHLKALTIAKRLGVELDRNNKIVQRRRFTKIMKECETLAQSLGITVLKGESEAEAAASKLQQDGFVDGVITTDGDAFLYGARQVYRNLLVTEPFCAMYDMSRVERELGLSRDDLVGMAVLNGCDYNPDGVSGLGRSLVKDYILSRDRTRTVTEELIGWTGQVDEISQKHEQLVAIKSKSHCTNCKHPGTKKQHTKSGCSMCPSNTCTPPSTNTPCTCTKHVTQRLLATPHMQCCVKFVKHVQRTSLPVKEIVEEFANTRRNSTVSPNWKLPPCTNFTQFMYEKLEWRHKNSADKFGHVAALHHVSQRLEYFKSYPVVDGKVLRFENIKKRRRKDKVDMYELVYTVLDTKLSELLESDTLSAILEAKLVEELLPEAVADFVKREGEKKEKQTGRKDKENVVEEEPDNTSSSKYDNEVEDGNSVTKLAQDIGSLHIMDHGPLRDITTRVVGSETNLIRGESHQNTNVNREKSDELLEKSYNTFEEKNRVGETGKHSINSNKAVEKCQDDAPDSDSDDDGYIPLSERIAMRRANKQATKVTSKDSSSHVSKSPEIEAISENYSMASELLAENEHATPQLTKESSTQTPNPSGVLGKSDTLVESADIHHQSEVPDDEYFDNDIQLLPQNFMDEYLDLTRETIDDISFNEEGNEEEGQFPFTSDCSSKSLIKMPRPSVASLDDLPEFAELMRESKHNSKESFTDELSLKLENLSIVKSQGANFERKVSDRDYHQFFFATPHEKKEKCQNSVKDSTLNDVKRLEFDTIHDTTAAINDCEATDYGSVADEEPKTPTSGKKEESSNIFDVSSFEFNDSVAEKSATAKDDTDIHGINPPATKNISSLIASNKKPANFSFVCSSNEPSLLDDFSPIPCQLPRLPSICAQINTASMDSSVEILDDSVFDTSLGNSSLLACGQFSPTNPTNKPATQPSNVKSSLQELTIGGSPCWRNPPLSDVLASAHHSTPKCNDKVTSGNMPRAQLDSDYTLYGNNNSGTIIAGLDGSEDVSFNNNRTPLPDISTEVMEIPCFDINVTELLDT